MSKRMRFVLMGVGLLVFALVVWFLVLNPIRGQIATTDAAIADEQTKLQLAQSQLKQAEVTKEEGKLNQARLLELAKMMPSDEELPSLLLQLQDLADQSGIDFIAITPGSPTAAQTGTYELLPLDLSFTGTYFDVSDFIYRAEEMVSGPGRLLAVKSVNLALGEPLPGETNPQLSVSVSLYAFIMGAPAAKKSSSSGSSSSSSDSTTTTTSASAQ
jgi:type IV pilus assembly protein PilO